MILCGTQQIPVKLRRRRTMYHAYAYYWCTYMFAKSRLFWMLVCKYGKNKIQKNMISDNKSFVKVFRGIYIYFIRTFFFCWHFRKTNRFITGTYLFVPIGINTISHVCYAWYADMQRWRLFLISTMVVFVFKLGVWNNFGRQKHFYTSNIFKKK